MMNWHELATRSHYQTAVAVQQRLQAGDVEEAARGIQELTDALSRSDRRALKSQIIRLMTHIIKWKTQPERRSSSWVATIEHARIEIADLLEEEPSLRPLVPDLLSQLFEKSRRLAESEMNTPGASEHLSWEAVFEEPYRLS